MVYITKKYLTPLTQFQEKLTSAGVLAFYALCVQQRVQLGFVILFIL
jgi:hypothetical protein